MPETAQLPIVEPEVEVQSILPNVRTVEIGTDVAAELQLDRKQTIFLARMALRDGSVFRTSDIIHDHSQQNLKDMYRYSFGKLLTKIEQSSRAEGLQKFVRQRSTWYRWTGVLVSDSTVDRIVVPASASLSLVDPRHKLDQQPEQHAQRACKDVDVAIFFPKQGGSTKEAKLICESCYMVRECLDEAMSDATIQGIWGGTTENERMEARKRIFNQRRAR